MAKAQAKTKKRKGGLRVRRSEDPCAGGEITRY